MLSEKNLHLGNTILNFRKMGGLTILKEGTTGHKYILFLSKYLIQCMNYTQNFKWRLSSKPYIVT